MSEIEGVGEAVTGGLIARAVEPEAGEISRSRTTESACLNCGTTLTGPFCAACGQKAHVRRSLRGFGADFIAGLFNFEGKFWRTLPMLAWRPGELTRRYIAGERARFISPVALYLFSVFLTFAVLGFTGAMTPEGLKVGDAVQIGVDDERAKLVALERERAAAAAAGKELSALDRRIATQKQDLADLERIKRGEVFTDTNGEQLKVPKRVSDAVARIQRDPQGAVNNVQEATSKFSWLLIPLSLPFMWLLFPFSRRYRMYDHTVFVTYSLSFMMILVIAAGLMVSIGWTALAAFLWFVPPVHMFWQLRGAYQLGRLSALFRTFVLTIFCFITSLMFAIAVAAIGVL